MSPSAAPTVEAGPAEVAERAAEAVRSLNHLTLVPPTPATTTTRPTGNLRTARPGHSSRQRRGVVMARDSRPTSTSAPIGCGSRRAERSADGSPIHVVSPPTSFTRTGSAPTSAHGSSPDPMGCLALTASSCR